MIQLVKEHILELMIVVKTALVLALFWSFDSIYLAIANIVPVNNFHEIMVDAKDVVSLIFSLIVLVIGVFKLKKEIKSDK